MTRVNIHIEDREGGRYFVQVESSFPNQRRGEAFPIGIDAALDKAREFCRDFGVDDAAALPMMRPALQADIDRAEAAQQAAGDVTSAKEWRDGSLEAINTAMASATGVTREMLDTLRIVTFEPKDPEFVDGSEIVRRKPGRPRKET